jgi:hypothetical protein
MQVSVEHATDHSRATNMRDTLAFATAPHSLFYDRSEGSRAAGLPIQGSQGSCT